MGWDRYREIVFERQKRLGVVPADTQLTPRPPEIPAWESLTKDERRVYARMMEVYAGFMAQSDYDIGRVIDTIRDVGALDNTMVIYIAGDNGASFEGNLSGTTNVMAQVNGVAESTAEMLERLDDLGGPSTTPMYPAGWAWAGNTPFQWGKRIASHLGGTRDPLVISWPKRIRDIGGVRTQFHHLIDVAPTILEAASIPAPASVNGVVQKPIEGVSMIYTFDEPKAAGRHETQYFELLANRSIYHDGWIAAARSGLLPWAYLLKGDFEREPWELYHLDVDYSEANNLADQFPDKLKALEKLFDEEARKNQVYPLDPRVAGYPHENSAPPGGRAFYTFYQGSGHLYDATAPRTVNRSYEFRAYVVIPPGGANGVLVAHGGSACGYSLFLKDGKPTYTYNFFQREVTTLASPQPLPEGAATIQLRFEYEGGGAGKGAMAVLLVNGGEVDRRRIPRTVPFAYSFQETFDVGEDSSSPVGDYRSPFPFSGVLQRLELQVAPVKLASEEELRFRADRLAALLRSQ